MDSLYNKNYFEDFYSKEGGASYSDKQKWYPFFDQMAHNIKEIFNPKVVLDAGCAYGYLVEALRNYGIEAYGIDISNHAISSVDSSIKQYCRVQSIADELPQDFPKEFDLIITIEVLEHLQPEIGEAAIRNLTKYTNLILLSSTDSDYMDVTHINIQKKEYWARLFARDSFYRDMQQSFTFISPDANLYRKRSDIENVIQEYEISMRILKDTNKKIYSPCFLYCDRGKGFCEEDKIIIPEAIFGEKIAFSVDLPQDIKRLRFDPTEDNYCIITDFLSLIDDNYVESYPINAMENEDIWLFSTRDPQIGIEYDYEDEDEEDEGKKLSVRGTIFKMKDASIAQFLKQMSYELGGEQ